MPRPRPFVLAFAAALAVAGCAGSSVPRPPFDHVVPVSENSDRDRFGERVRLLLKAGKTDRLEQFADSLRTGGDAMPSGYPWELAFYARGFGEVNEDRPESWARHLAQLRTWVDARLESPVPRLALARALIGRGWAARGKAWAIATPGDHMQRFEADLDEANRVLDGCAVAARDDPAWYDAKLDVQHGLGDDDGYRATYAAAVERFPGTASWYTGMSYHLMPRWYGAKGELEAYADTCGSTLPDSLRDEIYARIASLRAHDVVNVFREYPGLSWARIQRGLDVWERRCPSSLRPASSRALLALMARDRTTARSAIDRLGDRVDLDIWDSEDRFVDAWRWTRGASLPFDM